VIAVTAYAMQGDERRALDAGCDFYRSKPLDTRTLSGIVARLLESGAAHGAAEP
jgi:CheY-like chemotaxis protein